MATSPKLDSQQTETPTVMITADDVGEASAVEPGAAIGRYLAIEELGRGGMGVVLRAYDPRLSREVALKLLRTDRVGAEGRVRLVREAQAMAQLNHPNVVAVYDVDDSGHRLVMAMEYVRGVTLKQWLREAGPSGRSWSAIVDAFIAAGKGIVAAHAEGLLHRDFKPANVLMGEDGRVRVTDFGLARVKGPASKLSDGEDTDASTRVDKPEETGRRELSDPITQAGLVLGTPRYMAPEQHEGADLTPAADQYALCVALWEALLGTGPFSAGERRSGVGLYTAKCDGPPRWPKGSPVPGSIARAIRRGLAPSPRQRWPSVEALLTELQRGQLQPRRRRTALALGGVAVVAGAGVWMSSTAEQRRVAECERQGARIEDAWNDEARQAVRAGLEGTRASNASTTADKLMPWLDDYAQRWRQARTDVCLHAGVLDVSENLSDRATWCLDDRRAEFGGLIAELADADRETVRRAVGAAAGLRDIDACRDPLLLQRQVDVPTEARDEIRAVRTALSANDSARTTGAYEVGLAQARKNLQDAEALGWAPLMAAARRRVGKLEQLSGSYEEAALTLERAYFEAVNSAAVEDAFSAAEGLVRLTGKDLARFDEAERWHKHAEVMHNVLPDPGGLREATMATNLAIVRNANGQYADATALFERALTLRTDALGASHPHVAESCDNLASARDRAGAADEAARLHERGLSIREEVFGPDHPLVAQSLHNLALARIGAGAYEEAGRMQERALTILEGALGPDHRDVAKTLAGLGALRLETGAYAEAIPYYERALSILERVYPDPHPLVGNILLALGAAHRAASDDTDQAAEAYRRATAIFEAAHGPSHPALAAALLMQADLLLAEGKAAEALPLAERALGVSGGADVSEETLGHARFSVARALAETSGSTGASMERARALATQAFEAYEGEGPRLAERTASMREWLDAHPASR